MHLFVNSLFFTFRPQIVGFFHGWTVRYVYYVTGTNLSQGKYNEYRACALPAVPAGLDGSFVSTGARIPVGTDIRHRGCAYTVLQTVQKIGVYSATYSTVHYKQPLKSFEIRVGHSPGFGLSSVAILP